MENSLRIIRKPELKRPYPLSLSIQILYIKIIEEMSRGKLIGKYSANLKIKYFCILNIYFSFHTEVAQSKTVEGNFLPGKGMNVQFD